MRREVIILSWKLYSKAQSNDTLIFLFELLQQSSWETVLLPSQMRKLRCRDEHKISYKWFIQKLSLVNLRPAPLLDHNEMEEFRRLKQCVG